MPELPEVEYASRVLRKAVVGKALRDVRALHRAQRRGLPPRHVARLRGATIPGVERRGKHQLIELSTGEVAVVVEHSKVRRLKPRVLVVTGPDKKPAPYPAMLDLLYDPKTAEGDSIFIKRGLAPGAYGLDLRDFYLA
jgi:hypothetical protein